MTFKQNPMGGNQTKEEPGFATPQKKANDNDGEAFDPRSPRVDRTPVAEKEKVPFDPRSPGPSRTPIQEANPGGGLAAFDPRSPGQARTPVGENKDKKVFTFPSSECKTHQPMIEEGSEEVSPKVQT